MINPNKIKAGDKVKCIVDTTTGAKVNKGDKRVFNVDRVSGSQIYLKEFPDYFHYAKEFSPVMTKEDMINRIHDVTKECDEECRLLSGRIAYLNATGSVEYDDTEFRVWQVLQEIKTMKDDVSKAKAIASIVNA